MVAVKQFRSQFGTIVTHLTIVATRDSISVFDGEGNQIGNFFGGDADDEPIEIQRMIRQSDLIFMVIYQKCIQSYRIKVQTAKDTNVRTLNITREWTKSQESLNLTASIKQVATFKPRNKFRMSILDAGNTLPILNEKLETEESIPLGLESATSIKSITNNLVIQQGKKLTFKRIAQEEVPTVCQVS